MKIGVDVGALCSDGFGNYTFSINLINELMKYDKKNNYVLYSFCNKPTLLTLTKNFVYRKLLPKQLWIKGSVRIEELVNKKDIFLGLNQAFPISSSKKIIFSHGLSFYFFKSLYPKHYKRLNKQLINMLNSNELIIVSSNKVKKEFHQIFNKSQNIKVLNFGIPYDFMTTKNVKKEKYFLNVGVNHPIKNVEFLLKSFINFRKEIDNSYKLYIVTDRKYTNIKDKNIIQLTNISRKRLKKLYLYAKAYLTTSFYESFNLPILESLSQNTPVVALKGSFIPEMSKYISIARDEYSFVSEMKEILVTSKNIDLKSLKRDFSWNKYVEELIKMY